MAPIAAKITTSFNGGGTSFFSKQHFIHSQPKNTHQFLIFKAKYGFYKRISKSTNNTQLPKASASPNNPSASPNNSSSSWKNWVMGILLTVILPAIGHKGGVWVGLKGKIDSAIGTVEHVTEMVEELAEEADKIVEEVEKKLPGDSKLKEALESLDDLAKKAVVESKKAEDLIHKVRDVEEQIEMTLINNSKDEVKK